MKQFQKYILVYSALSLAIMPAPMYAKEFDQKTLNSFSESAARGWLKKAQKAGDVPQIKQLENYINFKFGKPTGGPLQSNVTGEWIWLEKKEGQGQWQWVQEGTKVPQQSQAGSEKDQSQSPQQPGSGKEQPGAPAQGDSKQPSQVVVEKPGTGPNAPVTGTPSVPAQPSTPAIPLPPPPPPAPKPSIVPATGGKKPVQEPAQQKPVVVKTDAEKQRASDMAFVDALYALVEIDMSKMSGPVYVARIKQGLRELLNNPEFMKKIELTSLLDSGLDAYVTQAKLTQFRRSFSPEQVIRVIKQGIETLGAGIYTIAPLDTSRPGPGTFNNVAAWVLENLVGVSRNTFKNNYIAPETGEELQEEAKIASDNAVENALRQDIKTPKDFLYTILTLIGDFNFVKYDLLLQRSNPANPKSPISVVEYAIKAMNNDLKGNDGTKFFGAINDLFFTKNAARTQVITRVLKATTTKQLTAEDKVEAKDFSQELLRAIEDKSISTIAALVKVFEGIEKSSSKDKKKELKKLLDLTAKTPEKETEIFESIKALSDNNTDILEFVRKLFEKNKDAFALLTLFRQSLVHSKAVKDAKGQRFTDPKTRDFVGNALINKIKVVGVTDASVVNQPRELYRSPEDIVNLYKRHLSNLGLPITVLSNQEQRDLQWYFMPYGFVFALLVEEFAKDVNYRKLFLSLRAMNDNRVESGGDYYASVQSKKDQFNLTEGLFTPLVDAIEKKDVPSFIEALNSLIRVGDEAVLDSKLYQNIRATIQGALARSFRTEKLVAIRSEIKALNTAGSNIPAGVQVSPTTLRNMRGFLDGLVDLLNTKIDNLDIAAIRQEVTDMTASNGELASIVSDKGEFEQLEKYLKGVVSELEKLVAESPQPSAKPVVVPTTPGGIPLPPPPPGPNWGKK